MVRLCNSLGRSLHPALQQQLMVNSATGIAAKAALERMLKPFKREVFPAPGIGPVQERAMLASIGHAWFVIGRKCPAS
jgi:hypothetical protein